MAIGPGCQPSWARKESAAWARWARASPMCKEGDRTLVPFLHPAWAERIKTDAPWLRPLPPGDINQFAMMGVNPPTAYLLLTDIVQVPRGSWVIQNGANSGVGRATVAIAQALGVRTVNVGVLVLSLKNHTISAP